MHANANRTALCVVVFFLVRSIFIDDNESFNATITVFEVIKSSLKKTFLNALHTV